MEFKGVQPPVMAKWNVQICNVSCTTGAEFFDVEQVAQSFCWWTDGTPSISGLIFFFLPSYWILWFCVCQVHSDESGTKVHPPEKVLVYSWYSHKRPWSHSFWKKNIAEEDRVEGLKKEIKLTISLFGSDQWPGWFHSCESGGQQTVNA